MAGKGKISVQGQCTAEIRTLYRLFPPGRRPLWLPARRAYSSERPEADSQLPEFTRLRRGLPAVLLAGPITCREPLGRETCRRAHVESLGAEWPPGRTSGYM